MYKNNIKKFIYVYNYKGLAYYMQGDSEIQTLGANSLHINKKKCHIHTYPEMPGLWVIIKRLHSMTKTDRIYLQWHMTNVIYFQFNCLFAYNLQQMLKMVSICFNAWTS